MLEPLGLSESEEAAYLALLGGGIASARDLAKELGVTRAQGEQVLARLRELGFVTHGPGQSARPTPVRPDVAVGALVARRSSEFLEVHRFAQELAADFPEASRTQPEDLVEVVVGGRAVATRFAQLGRQIEKEMLVLDRPPYAQEPAEENEAETEALQRDVSVRGIYAPEAFEVPGAYEQAVRAVEAGEQARVHADVPMKLVVIDEAVAMLPMTSSGGVDSALVVHAPMVVTALVQLFELLWRQASPLPDWGDPPGAVEEGPDLALLALLATGMKDEAIARELGISARTLGRRMAQLLEDLGVRTRFQAGVQAGRRGL